MDSVGYIYAAGDTALAKLSASAAQQYYEVFQLPKMYLTADGARVTVSNIQYIAATVRDQGYMNKASSRKSCLYIILI